MFDFLAFKTYHIIMIFILSYYKISLNRLKCRFLFESRKNYTQAEGRTDGRTKLSPELKEKLLKIDIRTILDSVVFKTQQKLMVFITNHNKISLIWVKSRFLFDSNKNHSQGEGWTDGRTQLSSEIKEQLLQIFSG